MQILLGIDIIFFLLELITGMYLHLVLRPLVLTILGYSVHSLALIADAFHMVVLLRIIKPTTTDSGKIVE